MRPDLDFRTLRQQIEAATWVPDFASLYRRAGRVRMRDRMAVLGALVGTLAVLAPVALAGVFGRPAPAVLGPNPDLGGAWSPSPAPTSTGKFPATVSLLAVAGDLPTLVAAVDVCVEIPAARRCSLQVTALGGTADQRPVVTDALRLSPLDKIANVQLTRLSAITFMLSGEVSGASRSSVWFGLQRDPADKPSAVLGPDTHLALGGGDLPVQLVQYGDLFGVRTADAKLSLIGQPELARRTVAAGLPAGAGWWVTGADLGTGQPSVAVSKDQGATWLARRLDADKGIDVPTVATADGVTGWAFVRYSRSIRVFKTTDAGANWREIRNAIMLPGGLGKLDNRAFGALVRADRSVLVWIQGDADTYFLDSNDGEHFASVTGPGGAIARVDNGYASLGDPARVSKDAVAWQEAALSETVLPTN